MPIGRKIEITGMNEDVDRFIQQLKDIEEFRLKEIPGAQ